MVGSDRYIGGMIDMGSGHLHPLNLALGEARAAASLGVALFEHSRVTHIEYGERVEVTTAHGRCRANYLVIGCNAYLNELNPELGARCRRRAPTYSPPRCWRNGCASGCCRKTWLCAIRTWRSTTTGCRPMVACCLAGPATTRGVIPGTSRRLCCPSCCGSSLSSRAPPSSFSGGMIGIGANRLPQIGRLKEHPNVFYAQAYSGHGLNATHMAAKLVAEAIRGEPGLRSLQ